MDDIEQLYELSPLQQGILVHSLYEEGGVYIVQVRLEWKGKFRRAQLEKAWRRLIQRHSVLRTSFHWREIDKPLQVVHQNVPFSVQDLDWRDRSPEEQSSAFAVLLEQDRKKGFDLEEAPLMRVTLIRTAEEAYHMLWSSHHLQLDGWSVQLLIKELLQLYQSLVLGQEGDETVALPYLDYIRWLQERAHDQSKTFWKKYLDGVTRPTPLGIDHRSIPLSEGEKLFGEQSFTLSVPLTENLRSVVSRHRLTMNTWIQGAWALLLSRYSQEGEVVFGTVVSGRTAELADMDKRVGLFIHTLPLRIGIDENRAIREWLQVLQSTQLEISQYEDTPSNYIQKWSQIKGQAPLFESIVNFDRFSLDDWLGSWGDQLQLTDYRFYERPHYPLSITAIAGNRLELKVIYDRRRLTDDAIQRLLGHLQHILEQMIADPSRLMKEVDVLSPSERSQLIHEWNQTEKAFPRVSVHEQFERKVDQMPNRLSVIDGENRFTYRELDQKANRLARYLQASGIQPGDFVGISMERCADLIIGLLAILKTGGVYVPLDPAYPAERVAYLLQDANIRVLLTHSLLADRFSTHAIHQVVVDREREAIMKESMDRLGIGGSTNHTCYVNYTSGSTGTPKGVLTPHRGVLRLVQSNPYVPFRSSNRLLQLSTLSFDAATFEIWGSLLNGSTLVIFQGERSDLQAISDAIHRYGITTLFLTTALFHQMVEFGSQPLLRVPYVLVGGEVLSVQHVKMFLRKKSEQSHLINVYGPTECTTFSTFFPLRDLTQVDGSVPIGRPIANTCVYVLDSQRRPVPIGVVGELYIGGDGLALGYLNRPDLTAASFIPHPFSPVKGATLYKTGDLVRYLPDGNLEFVGRIDQQMKMRGYRIEPGEIESVLTQRCSVKEAVVVPFPDRNQKTQLVAYVKYLSGDLRTLHQLREELKAELPEYMIPSRFHRVETFPLSLNGKIDRRALPYPDGTYQEMMESMVLPRNEVESTLAEIWKEALGIPEVGVNHNFFDLGGHSLIITRIMTEIQEKLGLEIPISRLFECLTIERLALSVMRLREEEREHVPAIASISRTQDEALLEQLDDLSDEEVEAMLTRLQTEKE